MAVSIASENENNDIPDEFKAVYDEIENKLTSAEDRIDLNNIGRNYNTAYGVELLVANSDRGEKLLKERARRAVSLTLDRLKFIGVKSISLSIKYPIFTDRLGRVEEYISFYRFVAEEIKYRDFVLVVEITTSFTEPEFSQLKVDYDGLTVNELSEGISEMALIIVQEMKPDYLTILSEPSTISHNTGLHLSVNDYVSIVRYAALAVRSEDLFVGSGAGTWDEMEYFEALASIEELDYLDIHIYPIQRDFLIDRILAVVELARTHDKRVSIGEAWLYKVTDQELGWITPVEAFGRDVWSFWQPLDERFIKVIVALADQMDAEFCSFFWMRYFYAYLDYSPELARLTEGELMRLVDWEAGSMILYNHPNRNAQIFETLTETP